MQFEILNENKQKEYFFLFEDIQSYQILFHLNGESVFNIYSDFALSFPFEDMAKDYSLCRQLLERLPEQDLSGYLLNLKVYLVSLPIYTQDYGNRHIRAILIALGLGLKAIGFSNNLSFLSFSEGLHDMKYNRKIIKTFDNQMESQVSFDPLKVEMLPILNNPKAFSGSITIAGTQYETMGSVYKFQAVNIEPLENQELNYNLLWDLYLCLEISAIMQMNILMDSDPSYIIEHAEIMLKRDFELLGFLLLKT